MKNLIKLGLATLLLISSFTMSAQTVIGNKNSNNSLLWEVSGNGLSKPSYITGTFHILCSKDFAIKPKVLKALEKSDNFVMEINYTEPSEMMSLQKMFHTDKKISDQLSPEEAKELNTILAHYGTDLKSTINQLKMDKEYEILFRQMIEAFKNENAQSLYSLFKDKRVMNSQQEKAMLTDRNQNWVKTMPEMMKKERSFFAVGGSHLMGENGIIPLLQAKGYTIKPVSSL